MDHHDWINDIRERARIAANRVADGTAPDRWPLAK